MPFLFENLDVYNQSMQLADELTGVTETFPNGKYQEFQRNRSGRASSLPPFRKAIIFKQRSFFRVSDIRNFRLPFEFLMIK